MPIWLNASLTIIIGITAGAWFAGEITRQLDEDYLVSDIRREMTRTTGLLSGLIVNSVITDNVEETNAIIRQYVSEWPEVTFVHVEDEDGYQFTEWKKRPIQFGQGILKFEAPIKLGAENFGILSVYADMSGFYTDMDEHISDTRHSAALILLSITMFIVCIVNYSALRRNSE